MTTIFLTFGHDRHQLSCVLFNQVVLLAARMLTFIENSYSGEYLVYLLPFIHDWQKIEESHFF
jgi:hypothetical protein